METVDDKRRHFGFLPGVLAQEVAEAAPSRAGKCKEALVRDSFTTLPNMVVEVVDVRL